MRREVSDPPEMLTPQAAAERLGTTVRFVRRLIAERRIAFFKVGRHVRISSTDLADYLAAGRVDPLRVKPGQR
jgi:excisionase family DNA binding protein